MKWRLIDTNYSNPYLNMAIDEALLTSKQPVLRFYRWKPSTMSIGYFQSHKDINLKNIKKQKLGFVRRPTGGKAVFHDKELTYSFIINDKKLPKSITESYKIISKGILLALKQFGLNADMKKEIEKKESSSICFKEPSYYEIIVNNKKIVGSAQTRKQGKILQHGSILLDIDIDKLLLLFKEPIEKKANFLIFKKNKIKQKKEKNTAQKEYTHSELLSKRLLENNQKTELKKRITSINNELNKKINYEELANALKQGFEKNFNIRLKTDKLTKKEIELADKLAKEKYSTKQWNFMR